MCGRFVGVVWLDGLGVVGVFVVGLGLWLSKGHVSNNKREAGMGNT